MLKRVYANRSEWKRVLSRKYTQSQIDTAQFKGYISLLHTIRVSEPLWVNYGGVEICIVDNDFMWLQQFPLDKNHSVTTMFDSNGEVVQWYIDICYQNSIENNIPYIDDLFLDIILLPSGELIEKDADELEEAYLKGMIDQRLYDLAWDEQKKVKRLIHERKFELVKLSVQHNNMLVNKLK